MIRINTHFAVNQLAHGPILALKNVNICFNGTLILMKFLKKLNGYAMLNPIRIMQAKAYFRLRNIDHPIHQIQDFKYL